MFVSSGVVEAERSEAGTKPDDTAQDIGYVLLLLHPENERSDVPMNDLCVPLTGQDRQEAFWAWTNSMVLSLVKALAEQTLALEMQAYLAAGWNERSASRRGYRNGHYRRGLTTPYGPVSLAVPRCRRSGFQASIIFDRYQRRIADVARILRHAYLLGTSTRATAELAEQIFGGLLSHQTISRLMRWLDGQLAGYRNQSIADVYRVVYIDGMHVGVLGGDRRVMLVMGLTESGRTEVLGFCVSSGEQCTELLWDLRRRGLEQVALFVSDDSGAIRSAVAEVFPRSNWQSCALHRLMGLRERIGPTDFRKPMVREAAGIFRAGSKLAARDLADRWAHRWRSQAPAAVHRFLDGLGDSLMFYTLPEAWWRKARTNNPLERLIRTLRQRLRPMGCFHDPHAVERAVFGQLARWHLIPKLTHCC
jgi:transposase-like protein